MTSTLGLRAAAFFVLIVVASCSPEIKSSPTQIMVRVNSSNAQLRETFTDLQVSLARREGDHWEQGAKQKISRKNIDGRWPVDLPVIPRSPADEIKQFEVVLDLLQGTKLLAQNRAVTTFLPNRQLVLDVWIEPCPGHASGFVCAKPNCDGAECEVCRAADGTCIPVGVTDPNDLSPLANDAIASDHDAGAVGRTKGSGQPADARAAIDPRADADSEGDQSDAGETQAQGCASEGALRCKRSGAPQRQVCESGRWVDSDPCADDEVCDGSMPDAAACVVLSSACKGSAGKAACAGSILQLCSDSGVATTQTDCKSERQCQLGLASGVCAACVPGAARCTGATLEVCSDDGLGFEMNQVCESASLCNVTAVACTKSACLPGTKTCAGDMLRACNADQTAFEDEKKCEAGLCDSMGKQCDTCLAGSTKCVGNVVQTCSADGQSSQMMACSGQASHCVGAGKCVQCAATTDCAAPANGCLDPSCNTAAGTCGTTPKAAHATCSGGVCDGAGKCVACTDDTDCRTSTKSHCSAARCVQCVSSSQCPSGQECQNEACVVSARCGDGAKNGTEQCDPTALGSSAWTCSADCKKTTMYTSCSSSSQCSAGEICYPDLWFCTKTCTAPTGTTGPASGCPTPPSPAVALCGALPVCVASGCSSRSQCARGMSCYTGSSPGFCVGCEGSADCDIGQSCTIPSTTQSSPHGYCQ